MTIPTDESTPRERRQERTRQAILSTAMQLIVENGPDKLSLREIARRIDYSPAGLYEYFGSKDEIIDAVCHEADDRLRAYLRAVPEALPPADYLVELGLAYVRFARENPEHFMFLFRNRELTSPLPAPDEDRVAFFEAMIARETEKSFRILVNAVRRAIAAGVIGATDLTDFDVAYMLWAQVHGLAMLQAKFSVTLPFAYARADRVAIQAFIRGLGR